MTESDSGTVSADVTFTLSAASASAITVEYQTIDGTAKSPDDYIAQTGKVVFNAGSTSEHVQFTVVGDTSDENDETFKVHVKDGTGYVASGTDGVVTITDNDPGPTVSINDSTLTEGSAGAPNTTNMEFTVSLSSPAGRAMSVWAFTSGPSHDEDDIEPNTQLIGPAATAGTDYTALNGTEVKFNPGDTEVKVNVPIVGDVTDENDEYFEVHIKPTNNAGTNDTDLDFGYGKIVDDDAKVKVNVSDPAPVQEGDTACGTIGTPCTINNSNFIRFTVTLSAPSGKKVVVDYTTNDRSANQNSDYVKESGAGDPSDSPPPSDPTELVFQPGQTSKTIDVFIRGDSTSEPTERFAFDLSNPRQADPGDMQAFGTILDNDPGGTFASVSVSDATPNPVPEASGTPKQPGTASFTIHVNRTSLTDTATYNIPYTTADGPASPTSTCGKAIAGKDYTAKSGTATIAFPQEDSAPITVNLIDDNINELTECFQLQLNDASPNASISDAVGEATISDDDPPPSLSIDDFTLQAEGTSNSQNTTASMVVHLNPASGQRITVKCSTTANSGTASDKDYVATTQDVVFEPGDTQKTCDIPVVADAIDENDETLVVALGDISPSGSALTSDGTGTLTIKDDDAPPSVAISSPTVTETDAPNDTVAPFVLKLSSESGKTITVHAATADGTAKQPADYTATTGDITFSPGQTEKQFQVPVKGDNINEANETFTATLTNPGSSPVTLGTPTGTATITDQDDPPSLSINDVAVTEGNTGTVNANFDVTLTGTTQQTVTVHYATGTTGTATSSTDYTPVVGDLSFAPGETKKTVTVPVKGDTEDEPNETFNVNISAPSGATVSDGSGQGTINDDDAPANAPTLSVGNASASEGDKATFTFTLSSAAPPGGVTVNYSTADGSAKTPGDYTAVPAGVATIDSGQTTKTVDVQTTEDTTHEPQETFTLTINSADNATVDQAKKTGTGTINDDDAAQTAAQITTGAGPGGGPHIQSFPPTGGTPSASFMDGSETTGKRVARGDVDGDGVDEIITGSGPGSAAVVSVYSATGVLKASTFAYGDGRFYGGVFVAAGDVDGDGKDEVVTGAGPGGGPHVIIWKVTGQTLTPAGGGFFPYVSNFAGGVTVAAADVNGDGKADIITGPGAGGGPDVEANSYNVASATATRLFGFMAYTDPNAQPNWTGGINVGAGDFDNDGKAEIAVVPWSGGGPHLRTFNHDGTLRNGGIFTGNPTFTGGLTVAVGDLNGDGKAEIIVGAWSQTNRVRGYNAELQPLANVDFAPYGNFTGGNFVAVGNA